MKRKCLAVGIILLFIGTSIISTAINATSINYYRKNLYERECSPLRENVTVSFMFPENGIYWNDHKIAPFSVPLILHGNGILLDKNLILTTVKFKIEPLENISEIDVYIDGILWWTWTQPEPFIDTLGLPMTRFSHANATIIAYTPAGTWGSNEITVWRLFL